MLAPTLGWVAVDGDKQKFRELHWMREGWNGGFEDFLLQQQLGADQRFTLSGHALLDDYKVTLSLEHSGGKFVRAGFEQFRKYYDDSGGYYAALTPPLSSLGRDLHLDLGKAWVEAGGITPFGLQWTGGYEYHFKEGEKSSTSWLPVEGAPLGPMNILPAAKAVDERVHVLRLDAGYDWAGFRFDDNFRYEFYDLKTRQTGIFIEATSTAASQVVRDMQQSQNLANAFKVEKQPLDWLLLSAGYLYTHTDGDTGFGQTPVDAAGQPVFGILWNGQGITLEQAAHVFNANAQVGIWEQMTLSAGLQTEWNRQRVFGEVNLDYGDPNDPVNILTNRATIDGDYSRFTSEEKFLLRNTQIPHTVLYAELRFRQEQVDQLEVQEENGGNLSDFRRDTEARREWEQYRAGFNVSPWTRAALNAYVQRRHRQDTFDHLIDEEPRGNSPGQGYPAFITGRENTTDEVGAKLVLRPASCPNFADLQGPQRRLRDRDGSGCRRRRQLPWWPNPGQRAQRPCLRRECDSDALAEAVLVLHVLRPGFTNGHRRQWQPEHRALPRPHLQRAGQRQLCAQRTDGCESFLRFSSADYGQNNAASGLPLGTRLPDTIRMGLGRRF